ncbi:MAG: LUD domain-containing protein [Anaerolineales bacterium]
MRREFEKRVKLALDDERLSRALDANAERRQASRKLAFSSLSDPDGVQRQAHTLRRKTIENLETHLKDFTASLQAHGVHVHRAADGEQAAGLVTEIARQTGSRRVVKSKSMVSEEVQLNHALRQAGLEVTETDLGEFIVQLRGESPSHITAPAIHLTRHDVARTFHEKLGMPFSADVGDLNAFARRTLREVFLRADLGVSGVNFGVAESGTLCLVTNEGNGRMVTTLPPVHVALMGIERIVPTANDLDVLLRLLPRSATGQKLTSYVTLLAGAEAIESGWAGTQRHVILVDNGRSAMRGTPFEEALLCIRCGACLNACPVFREIGGHAYGCTYPGPIGSLVSPGYFGLQRFGHLAHASTLCGACNEVCPVGIDLTTLLLRTRRGYRKAKAPPMWIQLGVKGFTWLASRTGRFRFAQRLAALASSLLPKRKGWIRSLPPPFNPWTRSRDFPPFRRREIADSASEFVQREVTPKGIEPELETVEETDPAAIADPCQAFTEELQALGGKVIRCDSDQIGEVLLDLLGELGENEILAGDPGLDGLIAELETAGIKVCQPQFEWANDRSAWRHALEDFDRIRVGITGAIAALADTGTLILANEVGENLSSLLPEIHLAVLQETVIHRRFSDWLREGGEQRLQAGESLTLITGPSRTADIEMTLTIGVHGPARVIVLLVARSEEHQPSRSN